MSSRKRVAIRDRKLTQSWLRVVRRTFRTELAAIEAATVDAETLADWYEAAVSALDVELWKDAIRSLYVTATDMIWQDTVDSFGVTVDADPHATVTAELDRFLDEKATKIVTSTTNYLSRMIASVPQPSLLARAAVGSEKAERFGRKGFLTRTVQRLYSVFRRDRAPRVAVVEALQAAATVQHVAALTVTKVFTRTTVTVEVEKVWYSVGDNRVRPAHSEAHGQQQPIEEPYRVDGEALRYPRDPAGSAGNVVNCRCYESYIQVRRRR